MTETMSKSKQLIKWAEEQKLPTVEGCENADHPVYGKYLYGQFGHKGCWRCNTCLAFRAKHMNYVKWSDLIPYWDENNRCSVDIRGQKRPLPIKFLKYIARAKGISVDEIKSKMFHSIPVDKQLYNNIKAKVYKRIPKHSAYRSGIVVKEYKEAFKKKW